MKPMFGGHASLFRSRWKALWWALGVLLTAYCSVPSPDEGAMPPAARHPLAKPAPDPWAIDRQ